MSLLLALALQASLPASAVSTGRAAPMSEEDIIVIARRVHTIRVRIRAQRRNNRLALLSCRIANGTGYQEIDSIPCNLARECMENMPSSRRALAACVEQGLPSRFEEALARLRSVHRG